jgi:Orsellinic acid/F9775 biosynthesis cluster protein D
VTVTTCDYVCKKPGWTSTGLTLITPTPTKPIKNYIINIADEQPIRAEAIPQTLSHLIQLNERYGVLICLSDRCRCAVSLVVISDHLRRKHKVQLELRKQVDRYIKGFLFTYDYSTVLLLLEGSRLEPVIDVVDGFRCKHYQ